MTQSASTRKEETGLGLFKNRSSVTVLKRKHWAQTGSLVNSTDHSGKKSHRFSRISEDRTEGGLLPKDRDSTRRNCIGAKILNMILANQIPKNRYEKNKTQQPGGL